MRRRDLAVIEASPDGFANAVFTGQAAGSRGRDNKQSQTTDRGEHRKQPAQCLSNALAGRQSAPPSGSLAGAEVRLAP